MCVFICPCCSWMKEQVITRKRKRRGETSGRSAGVNRGPQRSEEKQQRRTSSFGSLLTRHLLPILMAEWRFSFHWFLVFIWFIQHQANVPALLLCFYLKKLLLQFLGFDEQRSITRQGNCGVWRKESVISYIVLCVVSGSSYATDTSIIS